MDRTKTPKCRELYKEGEGVDHGCTTKGKKERSVNCNFMVGISYNCGEVQHEQYFGAMTGTKMADIVDNSFDQVFQKSGNSERRIL